MYLKAINNYKDHFFKWSLFFIISFLSWNYFGLLFIINIVLLFKHINFRYKSYSIFFLETYIFMLLWHLGAIGWLINVNKGLFALLANSIIYALVLSTTYYLQKKYKTLYFIIIWIIFEILINIYSFSTPLLTIGNSFSNQIYLIQWYKYSNVILGSFWFLIFSYLFYLKKYKLFFIFFIIPVFVSLVLFLKTNNLIKLETKKITSFNSQYYINQEKSSKNIIPYTVSKTDLYKNSTFFLLPEASLNLDILNYKNSIDYKILKKLIKNNIVKNIFIGVKFKFKNKNINGALFINKDTTLIKIKKKLVPYTEFLPKTLSFLNKNKYIYNVKDDMDKIKQYNINPIICYEAFFPFFISKNSQSTDVLLVIASEQFMNNSFFGKKQYNNILKLRAIENGLPLVKCSSFGNSNYINQKGMITDSSKDKEFYTFNIQFNYEK